MIRKIIRIDKDKCNGCGACASACHEGAIEMCIRDRRKGVGFYRWTHDIVEITGKDALEVLQKIYISNISKVAVGRSKYTASLDENGEIIDDVIVMHMADGLYWVSDLYGPRLLRCV